MPYTNNIEGVIGETVEKHGIPELTTEQIEDLCSNAEEVARKYILAKVPLKFVEKLDISVEAEGDKPLNLTVDVDLLLSKQVDEVDVKQLVGEALVNLINQQEDMIVCAKAGSAKEAMKASEDHLRNLT